MPAAQLYPSPSVPLVGFFPLARLSGRVGEGGECHAGVPWTVHLAGWRWVLLVETTDRLTILALQRKIRRQGA